MAVELPDRGADPKVPKFDEVVRARRQECVVGLTVVIGALIEFDGVDVSLVAVVHRLYGLVRIRIVDH